MEIIGLIEHPVWYDLKCHCSMDENDLEHKYPLSECLHCHYQEAEDSMPREDFEINVSDKGTDDDGNEIELPTTHKETIDKIKIVRGKRHEDIIGWTF